MKGQSKNDSSPSGTSNTTQNAQGRSWNQSTASFASPTDPHQQSMGSSIALASASPSPVPIATSTPRTAGTPPQPILVPYTRSEKQAEDELFQRIERLIRDFLNRPNRRYPYHRVLNWTLEDDPTVSYSVVVTINAPSMVID